MGRYAETPTANFAETRPDGTRRLVRYYRPTVSAPVLISTVVVSHVVAPDDRLDLISARFSGDAFGFWRIAEANDALDPDALVEPEAVGTAIVILAPGVRP